MILYDKKGNLCFENCHRNGFLYQNVEHVDCFHVQVEKREKNPKLVGLLLTHSHSSSHDGECSPQHDGQCRKQLLTSPNSSFLSFPLRR